MVQEVDQVENEKAQRSHWTMNCALFGAELFKKLSRGQIKREDAIAEIKNLSSDMSDETATYLLMRLNDLIY